MALRAVIFDYGMVLSAPPDAAAHRQLVRTFGAPAEIFEKHYWTYRRAYDAGEFNGAGYWLRCASAAGVTLTAAQITELIQADIRMWGHLNQPMVDWALQVAQAGFRTGILSNIGKELADALVRSPWVSEFNHNTWSSRLRLTKPDPAIYHHALEGLGVAPEEALFLDDRPENVLGAQAVGLQAVIFRDPQKLETDLERLGITGLLPELPAEEAA